MYTNFPYSNKWQAIVWMNAGLIDTRMYVSVGLEQLRHWGHVTIFKASRNYNTLCIYGLCFDMNKDMSVEGFG